MKTPPSFVPTTYYAIRIGSTYYNPAKFKETGKGLTLGPGQKEPFLTKSAKIVARARQQYAVDCRARRLSRDDWPEMEVSTFQTTIHETPCAELTEVDPMLVRQRILDLYHTPDLARAFRELRSRISEAHEFHLVLFRAGGKQIVDEIPDTFSYGKISFFRTEVSLVQAHLTIGGASPPRVLNLNEIA